MSNAPERISISPTYNQKRADDYYLVDRDAFPGKGTEYVRADTIEAMRAENERLQRLLVLAQWTLQPFSDCVSDDNGNCTVSDTHSVPREKFVDAYRIYRAIRAALTEKG